MIQMAIIGCGWAGKRHAQALLTCGGVLRWTVDTDPERAAALQRETGGTANTTADYRKALQDTGLDAVVICLPHNLHEEVAVAAAQAGKHILVEKPLAASLAGADRMIVAAERASVTLMVAENALFSPLNHKVRDLLQSGAIGEPALLQITREAYLARSFVEERPWFLNARAAAGGIMMSGGVHDFSTALFLLGEIESIYSLRARQRFEAMQGDDTSVALCRFKNGAAGVFVESFLMKSLVTAAGPEVHTLRLDGPLGSIMAPDEHTIRLYSERDDLRLGHPLVQHDLWVDGEDTFLLEARHFIECIRSGSDPVSGGRVMRRPFELVLAAYQSMKTGKPVAV